MKPRVLAASSGLAPWSMAAEGTRGKKNLKMGVKGVCPLGLPRRTFWVLLLLHGPYGPFRLPLWGPTAGRSQKNA